MMKSDFWLLVYFLVFFLLTFVMRSILVYLRTGINPLVLPRTQDAHGYVGVAFKVLMLICALVLLVLAFVPTASALLGAIPILDQVGFKWLGWGVLCVALIWVLLAQVHMGESWRIGIDTTNTAPLVTHGLFAISRNPIFLSIQLALLGLFLVSPNAAILAILSASEVVIQVQVRLEEQHLGGVHGQAYRHYCAKVPRWLSYKTQPTS